MSSGSTTPPAGRAGASPPASSALGEAVRLRRARRARRQREGEGSFAESLGMIGVLGWSIVAPTLAGIFVGRWLDHRLSSGILWTAGLLVLGLAAGCALAWRRVRG
jgi:ATP synthase protein I